MWSRSVIQALGCQLGHFCARWRSRRVHLVCFLPIHDILCFCKESSRNFAVCLSGMSFALYVAWDSNTFHVRYGNSTGAISVSSHWNHGFSISDSIGKPQSDQLKCLGGKSHSYRKAPSDWLDKIWDMAPSVAIEYYHHAIGIICEESEPRCLP